MTVVTIDLAFRPASLGRHLVDTSAVAVRRSAGTDTLGTPVRAQR